MELMKKFVSEESGQGMVEYGLIIALISVIALIAIGNIGTLTNDAFESVVDAMDGD